MFFLKSMRRLGHPLIITKFGISSWNTAKSSFFGCTYYMLSTLKDWKLQVIHLWSWAENLAKTSKRLHLTKNTTFISNISHRMKLIHVKNTLISIFLLILPRQGAKKMMKQSSLEPILQLYNTKPTKHYNCFQRANNIYQSFKVQPVKATLFL